MIDPHAILGLDPGASDKAIKSAYRKLAKQHHPDTGGDEAKFKEITEAYEILTGKREQPQQNFGGSPFGGAGFNPFETFFDQNIFDAIFRHGQSGRVVNRVQIDPIVLIQGGSFTYKYQTVEPDRNGRLYPVMKSVLLNVEPDSPAGIQIIVPNGQSGQTITQPNHIVLQLFPGNTERFQVNEMLHLTELQKINVSKAMMGGEHEIITPSGKTVSVKVPPGTQSGTIHRIRMAGLKSTNGTRGDYNIKFVVEIPAITNEDVKQKIMEILNKENV